MQFLPRWLGQTWNGFPGSHWNGLCLETGTGERVPDPSAAVSLPGPLNVRARWVYTSPKVWSIIRWFKLGKGAEWFCFARLHESRDLWVLLHLLSVRKEKEQGNISQKESLCGATVMAVQEQSSGQIQAAFPFGLVPESIMFELSPLPLVPHQGTAHLGNITLLCYFRKLWACQEAVLTFWWACYCVLQEKLERGK